MRRAEKAEYHTPDFHLGFCPTHGWKIAIVKICDMDEEPDLIRKCNQMSIGTRATIIMATTSHQALIVAPC
jgi:hypothetical protein